MTNLNYTMKVSFLKYCLIFLVCVIFSSCAKEKQFVIDGKNVTVQPYGWANADALKNDSIVYEMSAGNIAWSIIGVETIIVPVLLTGWQLYEPVEKKKK